MNSTGVFLRKDQVLFAGMTLAICVGKKEPETGPDGEPLVVITLIGGVRRMGLRCYPLQLMDIHPRGQIRANSFAPGDVLPHVRFMPTEVFTIADAPIDRELAVFVRGNFLRYDDRERLHVRGTKKPDGRFVAVPDDSLKWGGRKYPLPDGAKLIPVARGASLVGLAATNPAVVTTSPRS